MTMHEIPKHYDDHIRPMRLDDIPLLAARMALVEQREMDVLHGFRVSPLAALRYSLQASEGRAFTLWDNGCPLVAGGVCGRGPLQTAWILRTEDALQESRFCRWLFTGGSRDFMAWWFRLSGALAFTNYVAEFNALSLRWLQRLGARFQPAPEVRPGILRFTLPNPEYIQKEEQLV